MPKRFLVTAADPPADIVRKAAKFGRSAEVQKGSLISPQRTHDFAHIDSWISIA